jgi:E3 ubiquitin-protein ligase listerin
LPRIVGPWLAGTFDIDRTVARTASDAINLVFPTPEKLHGVWKAFQRPILEYCRDAALHETVNTLSDERTVSSDDANATYAHVVATSLSVISSLFSDLSPAEREKERDLYDEFFNDAKIWDFVNAQSAGVRRSMHRLTRHALDHDRTLLECSVPAISTAYVYKGLHAEQSVSALEFVQSLNQLTLAMPTIWTDAYTGKRPAQSRLGHFFKQGSQSSPADFWKVLQSLLPKLPKAVLPKTAEEAKDLLEAMLAGVSKRDERINASSSWPTYFTLLNVIIPNVEDGEPMNLLQRFAMPLIRHFLLPDAEISQWSIQSAKPTPILAAITALEGISAPLQEEWPSLADQVMELARMSQPEQSKDFDKSQAQVAAAGARFADLQRELWRSPDSLSNEVLATFTRSSTKMLEDSITLLRSRNGKPYGAAAIIEHLLHQCGQYLLKDASFRDSYLTFAENDLPKLVFGPSQRHLIAGLFATASDPQFEVAFATLLRNVLGSEVTVEAKLVVIHTIFRQATPQQAVDVARQMPELQDFVLRHGITDTKLLENLVGLKVISSETLDTVLANLVSSLSVNGTVGSSLATIDAISKADEPAVRTLISKSSAPGDQLLPQLLQLEQSPDDTIAQQATDLASRLSSAIGDSSSQARFGVVLQNLESVSESSMRIDALLELTRRLTGRELQWDSASDMLPALPTWTTALFDSLASPAPSLSLLSPFGGALSMVRDNPDKKLQPVKYDSDGLSQALRIAMYVNLLLSEYDLLTQLGERGNTVLALMLVIVQVAEDNLSVAGANGLWQPSIDSDGLVLDFIGEFNQVLDKHVKSLSPGSSKNSSTVSAILAAVDGLSPNNEGLSPIIYYTALTCAKLRANLFELNGLTSTDISTAEAEFKAQRASQQLFPLLSTIVGYQLPLTDSQAFNRYCNELVAELTDLDLARDHVRGFERLVILNCILRTQEDAVTGIAKQRLIFLAKKLLPWLEEDINLVTKTEVCKLLVELLPGVADMYGEHWEQSVAFLATFWNTLRKNDDDIVAMEGQLLLENASLKLLLMLRKLSKSEEPNDDLVDALKDKLDDMQAGLLNLLKYAADENDQNHQPLMITHELLGRQIDATLLKTVPDLGELFPLMYAPSRPVQQATFSILHQQIPMAQEQISFDAALDNKTAQLPDELLSLILEAPTLDSLADASFDRAMPLSLQGYLFSWRLLFDHFTNSSFRVKNDYIEQLKDGSYLTDLLRFAFDFLGHSRGKPVDASKFDIVEYVADSEPTPERDVQWLLIHLYYLALLHMPTLVKSYYLDIRSRQTSLAVESWTSKYLSPLIINAALQDVAEWSEKSVKEDPEDNNMTVKVGTKSKEINVSYLIDEQTMAIRVALPDAYPLASAHVQGINRVAVKEEKWQSWLRNCQGVITFSVSPYIAKWIGIYTDDETEW